MPARLKAAGTSTSHLGGAQLACLHHLMIEERSLELLRRQELRNSPSFEPDVTAALLDACEETLLDIEEALALLDRGDYGACPDCGIAIPFQRLGAVPRAAFCVPCQAKWERLSR
jgi:RNA polymerase-binding transcription factor DksA